LDPPYPDRARSKPPGSLLDATERNLWYGDPRVALARLGDAGGPRAGWLRGVALLATGRYEAAERALEPWLPARAAVGEAGRFRSLAASAYASGLRQRGRYDDAAGYDGLALAAAGDDPECRSDALVGLTADAIGRADAAGAADRLAELDKLPDVGWRAAVRRQWVSCELALLTDRRSDAVAAGRAALRHAEWAQAPRHIAKSLLFLGVSVREVARGGGVDAIFFAAVGILRRGERVAASVGAVPLQKVAIQVRTAARLELLR
jgi:hypothetical protein